MYLDSLTLTAIGIFIIALLLIVRFCIFGLCGGPRKPQGFDDHE